VRNEFDELGFTPVRDAHLSRKVRKENPIHVTFIETWRLCVMHVFVE